MTDSTTPEGVRPPMPGASVDVPTTAGMAGVMPASEVTSEAKTVAEVLGKPEVKAVDKIVAEGKSAEEILTGKPEQVAEDEVVASLKAAEIGKNLTKDEIEQRGHIFFNPESTAAEKIMAGRELGHSPENIAVTLELENDPKAKEVAESLGLDYEEIKRKIAESRGEPDQPDDEAQRTMRSAQGLNEEDLTEIENFDVNSIVDEDPAIQQEKREKMVTTQAKTRLIKDKIDKLLKSKGFKVTRIIFLTLLILMALLIIGDFRAQTGGAGGGKK